MVAPPSLDRAAAAGGPTDGRPLIDWRLAAATAVRLAPAGPSVEAAEAREMITGLRRAAVVAQGHVRRLTGLDPAGPRPTYVIDRASWIRANAAGLGEVTDHLAPAPTGRWARTAAAAGWRRTVRGGYGLVAGGALAALAPRVLGQFDLYGEGGRLLLVVPNIVGMCRKLDLDPADFRLWVCLHEETHRVQHQQAPWLAGRLAELVGTAVGDGPEADEAIDTITSLMSVVEGHADVVMDKVGTDVIATLPTIRRRFDARRADRSGLMGVLGRLVGLDRKMEQYRTGAAFCRGVEREVGPAGFARVFDGPEMMPTPAELTAPERWLARVA